MAGSNGMTCTSKSLGTFPLVLQCCHHVLTARGNCNGHSLLLVDSPCFAVPGETANALGKHSNFEFLSLFGFQTRWQNNAVLIPGLAQLTEKRVHRNTTPSWKQFFEQPLEQNPLFFLGCHWSARGRAQCTAHAMHLQLGFRCFEGAPLGRPGSRSSGIFPKGD